MGLRRLGGTLAALLSGGAVVAGGTAAVPVAVAVAAGAIVAATAAYGLGDRRYPLAVAVVLYLAAGGAVLGDAIAAPTAVAAPLLGVGGLLAVALLVRARLGNARRVATLPVDPGTVRRWEAGVARRVLAVQSVVGRVADAGIGTARLGAVVLVVAWAGAVAGATVAWVELARPATLAAETAALLGLIAPFYWGTDWQGLDAPDGPEPASLGGRLATIGAAFRREPPERADPPDTDPAPDPTTEDRTAGDGSGAVTAGAPASPSADPSVTAEEGSATDDDEDVAELPTAEEMGPAAWGTGGDDRAESDPGEAEADAVEAATPDDPPELPSAADPDPDGGEAPDDDATLPGVPETGDEAADGDESVLDLEADDGGDEDDVLSILEERDEPESIDGDASPAREAFGVYERVSEILGNDPSDPEDWQAGDGSKDAQDSEEEKEDAEGNEEDTEEEEEDG